MSREERRKSKLIGPWGVAHTVIWLLGLAVMAYFNWWWPGILVMIAISLVFQTVLRKMIPDAFGAPDEKDSWQPQSAPPVEDSAKTETTAAQSTQPQYPVELLPTNCPKCGGPTRGHEVRWTGPRSADCPFCGANLPLEKS
jgi:cytoskeletal protein RodZ